MYSYSPFRSQYGDSSGDKPDCFLCDEPTIQKQIICNADGVAMRGKYYMWLINYFPKFEGHTMVVPIAHITKLDDVEVAESLMERHQLSIFAQKMLKELYPGAGIETFVQSGEGSGSSVVHIHWHIVPAQPDDKLRSFAKLGHFYTISKDEKLVIDFPVKIMYAREELQQKLAQVIGNKSWND